MSAMTCIISVIKGHVTGHLEFWIRDKIYTIE